MKTSKMFYRKNIVLSAFHIAFAITAGILFAFSAPESAWGSGPASPLAGPETTASKENDVSKVVLSVENMSCSGCISTIKSSLEGIEGIRDVEVDIAGGKADVYYDKTVLKDPSRIEKAITESGYPSKILRTVSAKEIRKEKAMAADKSETFIASVNGKDIARADFDAELIVVKKSYAKTYGTELDGGRGDTSTLDKFKARAAVGLMTEGIMLAEADKSGVRLNAGEVNAAFEKFVRNSGKTMPEMKAALTEAGYEYDMFMRRFESTVLINKFIDEQVFAGMDDPDEKKRVLTAWFKNAKGSAEVVYYDKEIERLVKGRGGSGSCCAAK
ncbi:MAG: cation transporter [Deltaproteobacteria bacterium]|nr:cation transporter [Deltaproteobacteria bacterium]